LSNHAAINLINRRYIVYGQCPELQGQDQSVIVLVVDWLH